MLLRSWTVHLAVWISISQAQKAKVYFDEHVNWDGAQFGTPLKISWHDNVGEVYLYLKGGGPIQEAIPRNLNSYSWTPSQYGEGMRSNMSTGVHYQVQMFDDENYSVFSPQFQVKAASIQENKDPESYTVSKLTFKTSTTASSRATTTTAPTITPVTQISTSLTASRGPVQTSSQASQTPANDSSLETSPSDGSQNESLPTSTVAALAAGGGALGLLLFGAIISAILRRRKKDRGIGVAEVEKWVRSSSSSNNSSAGRSHESGKSELDGTPRMLQSSFTREEMREVDKSRGGVKNGSEFVGQQEIHGEEGRPGFVMVVHPPPLGRVESDPWRPRSGAVEMG